ncbi:hypothetical protein P152DRAFT_459883 [Eremomyces bilateralis CBS 781.70]|uniref:Uncharacterized protein n=1 Tax=Eremomyces bilateralis CBS 781.70 TaxID=1392243 RepID=A0A6G1FZL8_9PEZI|nr:uncharacterized protein P152DRAFT_459883 [Eremomyces bilateralis CBS 781.70]KAF1811009.1 hypothetical protein P152DRAFT_459883 [Eremomyces bilateralis CBS 781.70]
MFCLRSWIPILFFLTNASPLYLILFISATYVLNRPCVYCSLLLAILVISLFDFHSNWFEPRYASSPSPATSSVASAALQNLALETASLVAEAMNGTAGAMLGAVVDGVKQRMQPQEAMGGGAGELIRAGSSWTKKEWRVPCIDVVVRL